MSDRKLIRKKEVIIIALVLVISIIALGYFGMSKGNKIAKIYVDSKVYKEINLSKHKGTECIDIESNGKMAHILIEDEAIGFINHECPDGICENAGMLKSNTQTAICLPLKISIVIEDNSSKDGLDIIAG